MMILFSSSLLLPACDTPEPRLAISGENAVDLASPNVSFVSFGDWGTGREDQREVADAIGNYCDGNPCDFILTLGDNFYEKGVSGTDDPQWNEKWRDIYGSLNLPFYATAGNHDAYGNLQAEIDYSSVDSNWRMPATDYSFSWPIGDPEPLVEIFVVGVEDLTPAKFSSLQEAISSSRAKWKFLARHYPLLSNLRGTDSDPLLERAACTSIDLVLSGHNHIFSFLRGDKDSCWFEQLILGTGGAALQTISSDLSEGKLAATASAFGFGWFQISTDRVLFRMIATDGSIVYNTAWVHAESSND